MVQVIDLAQRKAGRPAVEPSAAAAAPRLSQAAVPASPAVQTPVAAMENLMMPFLAATKPFDPFGVVPFMLKTGITGLGLAMEAHQWWAGVLDAMAAGTRSNIKCLSSATAVLADAGRALDRAQPEPASAVITKLMPFTRERPSSPAPVS